MGPLATADPTARILLEATSIGFAVSETSIRVRSATVRGGRRADRGSIVAVVVGLVAGVGAAVWCADVLEVAPTPGGWAPFLAGLLLMWLGVALRQWAVLVLGRFFTVVVTISEDQVVVDRGPYRWVRHPSYTGLLVTLVGRGLALGDWVSVLALATLPTIGVVIRIRVEEQALLAALGEPYRVYAAQRRRLAPGVW